MATRLHVDAGAAGADGNTGAEASSGATGGAATGGAAGVRGNAPTGGRSGGTGARSGVASAAGASGAAGMSGASGSGTTTVLGEWSKVPSGTTQHLFRVWGSARDDVWVVGTAGTILHFDGLTWSSSASGIEHDLYGVWGSGPNDVWAVGASAAMLHFDGLAWSPVVTGSERTTSINAVWGSEPNDVWAVGSEILHFDGSNWTSARPGFLDGAALSGDESQRGDADKELRGVWGSATNDVWAVGANCSYFGSSVACYSENMLHWDGALWSVVVSPYGVPWTDVWGSGPRDVWATSGGWFTLYPRSAHLSGSEWSFVAFQISVMGIWGSAADDVWLVSSCPLHYDGVALSAVPCDFGGMMLFGVWGSEAGQVWAVGEGGLMLHYVK